MRYYPFFIHIRFSGDSVDDGGNPASPLDEVDCVELGYEQGGTLAKESFTGPDKWDRAVDWLGSFRAAVNGLGVAPVGYDLRNLEWPCLVAHVARLGRLDLLDGLLAEPGRRWNNVDMFDLSVAVMQGGYAKNAPDLRKASEFFGLSVEGEPGIDEVYALFRTYYA